MSEEPLPTDGRAETVSRDGDVVLRTPGPHTPAVLAPLRHLERLGYDGAPRPVGGGVAPDGREAVTYLAGTSPHPRAWPDEALPAVGALLRDLHQATASFEPPRDAAWKPWYLRSLPGGDPVIGHCDTGPCNVVADGGRPVAFIDWELAGPVDAM